MASGSPGARVPRRVSFVPCTFRDDVVRLPRLRRSMLSSVGVLIRIIWRRLSGKSVWSWQAYWCQLAVADVSQGDVVDAASAQFFVRFPIGSGSPLSRAS